MDRAAGKKSIDNAGRQHATVGGQRRTSRCAAPTATRRAGPRNETLANLSALPDHVIEALGRMLKGATLVDADEAFEVERSVPHGNAAAAHVMASRLHLRSLLGPPCRERDIAYALILSRTVRPESKLSTPAGGPGKTPRWELTLGVAGASTDEVYTAMDWLMSRQREIEARLAARHLCARGIAMFDLSPSWVEGSCCELAAFGHSRDGKRVRKQIEFGLLNRWPAPGSWTRN